MCEYALYAYRCKTFFIFIFANKQGIVAIRHSNEVTKNEVAQQIMPQEALILLQDRRKLKIRGGVGGTERARHDESEQQESIWAAGQLHAKRRGEEKQQEEEQVQKRRSISGGMDNSRNHNWKPDNLLFFKSSSGQKADDDETTERVEEGTTECERGSKREMAQRTDSKVVGRKGGEGGGAVRGWHDVMGMGRDNVDMAAGVYGVANSSESDAKEATLWTLHADNVEPAAATVLKSDVADGSIAVAAATATIAPPAADGGLKKSAVTSFSHRKGLIFFLCLCLCLCSCLCLCLYRARALSLSFSPPPYLGHTLSLLPFLLLSLSCVHAHFLSLSP